MKNLIAMVILTFLVSGLYSCDQDEIIEEGKDQLSIIDNVDADHVANTFTDIKIHTSGGKVMEDYILVHTASDFQALWNDIHSHMTPIPAVPTIDFDTYGVAAAFMGQKTTGGYSIRITGVYTKNETVFATIEKVVPSPNDVTTQALTEPYHLVKYIKN